MTKVWYKSGILKKRVGIITDIYGQYVEVQDEENGEYHIVHQKAITPIVDKKTEHNYIELHS